MGGAERSWGYGLVYVHDGEDDGATIRPSGADRSNVFRVLRLLHGAVEALDDPFFGEISPLIEPDWL